MSPLHKIQFNNTTKESYNNIFNLQSKKETKIEKSHNTKTKIQFGALFQMTLPTCEKNSQNTPKKKTQSVLML